MDKYQEYLNWRTRMPPKGWREIRNEWRHDPDGSWEKNIETWLIENKGCTIQHEPEPIIVKIDCPVCVLGYAHNTEGDPVKCLHCGGSGEVEIDTTKTPVVITFIRGGSLEWVARAGNVIHIGLDIDNEPDAGDWFDKFISQKGVEVE